MGNFEGKLFGQITNRIGFVYNFLIRNFYLMMLSACITFLQIIPQNGIKKKCTELFKKLNFFLGEKAKKKVE